MIEKLKRPLNNKDGSILPFALAVILFLMTLVALVAENQRLFTVATEVKQSISAAAVSVAIANYDDTYSGTREGYSGGYQLNGSDWNERIDLEDIKNHIASDLKLKLEDGALIKKISAKEYDYKITNLEVKILNPSFKGTDELEFTIISSVYLTLPHTFGYSFMPPITIKITDTSNWTNKY